MATSKRFKQLYIHDSIIGINKSENEDNFLIIEDVCLQTKVD